MLEPLGLDQVAERIYRALLEHPSWGLDDICCHVGLPTCEVRDALDRLASLSLVTPAQPRAPLHAVQPSVGLKALLARTEADLSERQRDIAAARAAVAALSTEFGAESASGGSVERIDGIEAVRERLRALALSARRECLSFVPGGAQKTDAMAASKPLDRMILERGVAVRSIFQESFRNDPATLEYVQWLASLDGETRIVPLLPMQLVIVDREFALVPLDPADTRRGALVLSGTAVVAAVCALFDQFWRTGLPWGQRPPRNDAALTPLEHELLWILAQGHTDEVAARRLGLSLRTVRRMASEIMARLNARSRFEAGVRAVRQGWL